MEAPKNKEGFSDFHTSVFAARNYKSEFAKWDDANGACSCSSAIRCARLKSLSGGFAARLKPITLYRFEQAALVSISRTTRRVQALPRPQDGNRRLLFHASERPGAVKSLGIDAGETPFRHPNTPPRNRKIPSNLP
jgi:hypothetical protein